MKVLKKSLNFFSEKVWEPWTRISSISFLFAVPSQVIVARTLSKPKNLMSVTTKIAIQMNCKLGGDVWGVEMPLRDLMVVGIDCYHDSGTKGRSVGGVVASMNQALTRYYSRCTFQMNHTELMNALKICMTGTYAVLLSFNLRVTVVTVVPFQTAKTLLSIPIGHRCLTGFKKKTGKKTPVFL